MQHREFVYSALQEASRIARANFGRVSMFTKPDDNNQVLTISDVEIGKSLVQAIQERYPNYNVVDEELGIIDGQSEYTWVVDPIDGTSNFASGIPTYGIMIGLLKHDEPIVGGVALPQFNEVYYAEKGFGATCNEEPITVTSEQALLSSLVAYGIDGHQERPQLTFEECILLASIILNIRNLRSSNSVFDTALVAKGAYGAEINRTSKIWDNVARQILIEEAGGLYTDFFGKPIDYARPLDKLTTNYEYCAAAPKLHQSLQRVIHEASTSSIFEVVRTSF